MTIDEAIKILERSLYKHTFLYAGRDDEALGLSIEALKRCQILAKNDTYWAARPLEGETED